LVNVSEVAIATVTRARDRAEEQSLEQSLSALAAIGIPIAVSDGGSRKRFVEWMRGRPSITVARRGESLVSQVRASLAVARRMRRRFILYTEPDKRDFFDRDLTDFIERASTARAIGIQLAARSAPALMTFPPFQRMAEANASALCRRTIGADTDYFYGPFLVRRELARLAFTAADDLGWGWRPFLFVDARRRGYRIVGISGAFECPHDQRRENDGDKEYRLRQFSDNVRGVVDGLRANHL
jgi:hypothetical protein